MWGACAVKRSRKVKILATLGPASADRGTILALHQAGAGTFRINMSHKSHDKLHELVGEPGPICTGRRHPCRRWVTDPEAWGYSLSWRVWPLNMEQIGVDNQIMHYFNGLSHATPARMNFSG